MGEFQLKTGTLGQSCLPRSTTPIRVTQSRRVATRLLILIACSTIVGGVGCSCSSTKPENVVRTKPCPKCRGTGKTFLGEPCTVCYGRLKVAVTSDEVATEKWHQENFDRVARGEKPLKYFQWWIREHWLKVLFIGSLIALGTWAQATRDKANSGSQPPSDSRSDHADRE